MPISSASIKFKRFRRRFGISAPRLSIRRHVPWYWRILSIAGTVALSLAIMLGVYEFRGAWPSTDRDEAVKETLTLKKNVAELNAELEQLRVLAKTMESNLQIEHTLQQQLSSHVKRLEMENVTLKQDLAFFETLMSSSMHGEEGIRVDHLKIEPGNISGEYHYRMLVINNSGRQTKETKGNLQLLVKVRQEGKDVMITVPSESDPAPQRFRFEIKYFYRLEGAFSIPEGAEIKSVEARLMQDGIIRAKQSISL
ncbi:MAG: hypothetical protein LBD67_06005 [Candidatus Accumulibacter sp.]|jgi:hypothetical protein|nr:hypothetical protein [Accumulibacter sp.]